MGFFNRLGRKVEKLKQEASSASEDAEFGCANCQALLYADYDECPECGAEAVVALEGD